MITNDDRTRLILAIVILVTFGAYVWKLTYGPTTGDQTLIGAGLGYMAAIAQAVVQYFFGSSSGSALKTNLLADKRGNP
jgi:hypothetical protein